MWFKVSCKGFGQRRRNPAGGCGLVTTDRRLVCGLDNKIVTGVGQVRGGDVPWGSLVCPADGRLGLAVGCSAQRYT